MKRKITVFILTAIILSVFYGGISALKATDDYIVVAPEVLSGDFKSANRGIKSVSRNGAEISDDEPVATGDAVVTGLGSFKAAVLGDLNGNGRVDAFDYLLLKKFVLKSALLENEFLKAADIDQNGEVRPADYLLLKKHVMKSYIIKTADGQIDARGNGILETVVAFGDSLTVQKPWLTALNNEFGITIHDAGVAGSSTAQAKTRFQNDVVGKAPSLVFICFGMNDSAIDLASYVPIDDYKDNLRYFIDNIKAAGGEVIMIVPNYIDEDVYYTRHDKSKFEPYGGAAALVDLYCGAMREVAAEKQLPVADVRAACDAYADKNELLSDGVHPTELGYSIYASLVGAEIKKLLD